MFDKNKPQYIGNTIDFLIDNQCDNENIPIVIELCCRKFRVKVLKKLRNGYWNGDETVWTCGNYIHELIAVH